MKRGKTVLGRSGKNHPGGCLTEAMDATFRCQAHNDCIDGIGDAANAVIGLDGLERPHAPELGGRHRHRDDLGEHGQEDEGEHVARLAVDAPAEVDQTFEDALGEGYQRLGK